MNLDNLALQNHEIRNRLNAMEDRAAFVSVLVYALAGLVFAAVLVGAFELRAINHHVEASKCRLQ